MTTEFDRVRWLDPNTYFGVASQQLQTDVAGWMGEDLLSLQMLGLTPTMDVVGRFYAISNSGVRFADSEGTVVTETRYLMDSILPEGLTALITEYGKGPLREHVFVASGPRNKYQPTVTQALHNAGLSPLDTRERVRGTPPHNWVLDGQYVTSRRFREMLDHPSAQTQSYRDLRMLETSAALILVLPAGKAAHLEYGWAQGRNLPTAIYTPDLTEPNLKYTTANLITDNLNTLTTWAQTNTGTPQ